MTYSEHSTYRPIDRRLEQVRAQGISIQPIVLRSRKLKIEDSVCFTSSSCLALQVQINALQREFIPAGTQIHMIKSARGSFIRTVDGKFFAIRQPTSTALDPPKPLSTIPSPPPPPPPPPPPLPAPPVSSFLDELLLDSPSLPSTSNELYSSSSLMSDLHDEIDLLLDDTDVPPPSSSSATPSSSSTLENFPTWEDDYLRSNDFFSDLFLDQSV